MLEYRRLAVLRAVGRAGSMAGAAADLAFTPSAVSQQVAALERRAGTPLVIRQPRGIQLTEAGELLVSHTDVLVERLQQAQTELENLIGLRAGRLRMASFATAGSRLLPEAVGAFRSEHPEVDVSLEIVRELMEVPTSVRDGVLDLGITFEFRPGYGTPGLELDGLHVEHLLDDEMLLALPAEHRLADQDSTELDVAELAGDLWIHDDGPVCSEALTRMCAAAGFEPQMAFESDDYTAVGRLVASGVGVALVPALAADGIVPGVVLRRTRPKLVRRIVALVPETASPAAQAMLANLLACSPVSGERARRTTRAAAQP